MCFTQSVRKQVSRDLKVQRVSIYLYSLFTLFTGRWTHTLANASSNLWWFVVTKTFKELYTNLGPFVPFFLYGSVCLFGFLFIYVFLPETHGKTSEETAKSFSGFRPVVKRTGCKAVCSMCHSTCQCVPLILRKNGRHPTAEGNNHHEPAPAPASVNIATAATAAAISTMCSAVEPWTQH